MIVTSPADTTVVLQQYWGNMERFNRCDRCKSPLSRDKGIYKLVMKGNLEVSLCGNKCFDHFTNDIKLKEVKKVEVLKYESNRNRPRYR